MFGARLVVIWYFLAAFVAPAQLPTEDSWGVSQLLVAFIPVWIPIFQEQLWYTSPCKHRTSVRLSEYLGSACKILQVGQRAVCLPSHGRTERSLGLQPRPSQQRSSSVAMWISKPNPLLTASTILNCSCPNLCLSGCSQCVPAVRVCNLPGSPGHIPQTRLLIRRCVEQEVFGKDRYKDGFFSSPLLRWRCLTLFKFDVGFRIAAAQSVQGFGATSAG